MTVLVTVTLTPKEGKTTELVRFASGVLLETINSLGCIRAEIFSSVEEKDEIQLLGEWDNYGSYDSYVSRHTDKGDLDKLLGFLKQEPVIRYFSDQHDLVHKVKQASARKRECFNSGDAQGCAALYEASAEMNVTPHGKFKGRDEIAQFWANLIADGFNDITYQEPFIYVVDADCAVISAQWQMNKATGVITKELWKLHANGQVLLSSDNFLIKSGS